MTTSAWSAAPAAATPRTSERLETSPSFMPKTAARMDPDGARELESAVARVLAVGNVRTPDIGGSSSTEEVTEAVLEQLA